MKIAILNGNSDAGNTSFDGYLAGLERLLAAQGHSVETCTLRDLDLRSCIGCFGCWVKTPGECITPDEGVLVRGAMINSDFVLFASPLRMGYPEALLKRMMDKSIPLIHPYFEIVSGEAHHRKRYAHYPLVGLLMQPEETTDERDLQIITDMFRRTALNMKSHLQFALLSEEPVETVAKAITEGRSAWKGLPAAPAATAGVRVTPPLRLTVFNGSPRGRKSNTHTLWEQFLAGFSETGEGRSYEFLDLNRTKEAERFPRAFDEAECVLLGFPLYTDAMPGIVKSFIEQLEPFRGRAGNPPIGFLVQSGFPEAIHSRYVECYLEKLAERLGSPYLGTVVKGGAEGIQTMPDTMTNGLYTSLRALGKGFGETGQFDPQILRQIAGRERYPIYLGPIFQLLSRTPLLSGYWDGQMKKNGVFEKRYARPYEK